ncbi:MAG: M3 family metallopeptidase, partial [Chloroflexi bacterium]|nr:M3 family metallopeptidase [Chloroflexota bacterium]
MTTETPAQALPHWDMTVIYPNLDSPQFENGFAAAVAHIADLAALFDAHAVGARDRQPLDEATVRAFDTVIARYNDVLKEIGTLGAYISSFVSTNSRDDHAQSLLSTMQRHTVLLAQLDTRLTAWIGSLDVDALLDRSETVRAHAYTLQRARVEATHQMSPDEEALAAELEVTGGTAWGKLHGNWTSQLSVPVELDGVTQELPMSRVRNLAYEPDRETRRRAYEAELAAWGRAALPLAAALNSIKGEGNALAARRGWPSPLDAALFGNNIDRPTLDAMMEAARASFPDFRRYLRAKARALGVPALAWYDLFAPVGRGEEAWSYDRGTAFIADTFGGYAPKMRDLASRAVGEKWIDAEPRPGKRDGAFCMLLRGAESRILSNYAPTFEGVSTLAHELGHAYHNL